MGLFAEDMRVSFLPPRGSCVRARSKDAALLLFSLHPPLDLCRVHACVFLSPSPLHSPVRSFLLSCPSLFLHTRITRPWSSRTPPPPRSPYGGVWDRDGAAEQRLSADATIISCRVLITYFPRYYARQRWSLAMKRRRLMVHVD